MALVNVWHLRKVAEASAKPCDICYKPTTSVLITPDSKVWTTTALQSSSRRLLTVQDFFYLCLGHTKDRGFCSPIINEAEAAAKKKQADLEREIVVIKQEYEEKPKEMKKSKDAKNTNKDKGKQKDDKPPEKAKKEDDEDGKLAQERDEKVPGSCRPLRGASLKRVTDPKAVWAGQGLCVG